MLRVGICCRESEEGRSLEQLVKTWGEQKRHITEVINCSSGEEVLIESEERGSFHVVFLDEILGDGTCGVEIAEKLRNSKERKNFCLIYLGENEYWSTRIVNTHPCMAYRKPLTKEKLYHSLDHAIRELDLRRLFTFRFRNVTYNINLGEVIYFASEKRKIRLVKRGGKEHIFYEKMDVLEKQVAQVDSFFRRIHQSFIINEEHVSAIRSRSVLMDNGDELPVSSFYKLH